MAANRKIQDIAAPGIRVEGQILYDNRRAVASILNRSQISFPGAQPVSFSRRHLQELLETDYYVCEKSDGIRFLLWLTVDENGQEVQYLIDRKNDYWFIQHQYLHFPVEGDEAGFHTHTLVDGELVLEDLGGGNLQPKFLVFDCLVLDNKNLMGRTLDKRLGYFSQGVFNPYRTLFKKYPNELQYQAFELVMKDMQFSYGIEMMFRTVLPSLKHGNDGLIFTCRNSEYRHGTDQHILKWKPVEENTIDFRIELRFPEIHPDDEDRANGITEPWYDWEAHPQADLNIFMGDGRYKHFAEAHITEEEWGRLKKNGDPISNRIVECYLDEQQRWRLYRFRDDKAEANHISTANSVMESIRDSVSQQELQDAAKGIKDNWKARQAQEKR